MKLDFQLINTLVLDLLGVCCRRDWVYSEWDSREEFDMGAHLVQYVGWKHIHALKLFV